MIHRLKRHASYYSVRDLMLNDTIRLGNHPQKWELIFSPESKYHPEFGALVESEIVSDRIEIPSLVMSFVILGSVIIVIIAIFVKYLIAERQYQRELEMEQSAATICEDLYFPNSSSTDPFFQRQISTSTANSRRKSILKGFREFRL